MRTLSLLPPAFVAVSVLGVRYAIAMKDFHLGLEARSIPSILDDSRSNRGNRLRPANPAGDRRSPDQYRSTVNRQPPTYSNFQLQANHHGGAGDNEGSHYYTTRDGGEIYFSIEDPDFWGSQEQYLTGVSDGHRHDSVYRRRSYTRLRPDPDETPEERDRREAIERSEGTPPHLPSSTGRGLQTLQSGPMTRQRNLEYRSLLRTGNGEPSGRIQIDSETPNLRVPGPRGRYPGSWSPQPTRRPSYVEGLQRTGPRPSPADSDLEDLFADVRRGVRFRSKKRDEPHPRHEKRDVMSSITTQEDEATFGVTNSSVDQSAEFQLYLAAYRTAQANISDLLFPIFDVVLNGTSSSLIYDLVWSVYSDLTGIGPVIVGPYSYGMHCFDWIEDLYFNGTNTTRSGNLTDPTTTSMLATHQILINIYNFVWTEATTVANANGLLDDMYKLSQYLMPTNKSIATQDWLSPERDFDNSYFTIYNETSVYPN